MTTKVNEEAHRRWPDEPKDSGRRTNPRFSAYRRGFMLGAWWQAGQPTEDEKLEQARRAGQLEALYAVQGYINRMYAQEKPERGTSYARGYFDSVGHIGHMASEAAGQIRSERPVKLFGEETASA